MNSKADWFFTKATKWQDELQLLRRIALSCQLTEDLKWGCPCYTFQRANIVLIHAFKDYCAFLFFKGSLLKDSHGILVQQTENVQAARQIRFSNAKEIVEKEAILKAYIYEAVEVEEGGLKVEMKKTAAFTVPEEFKTELEKDASLRAAFQALTPGRQRAYLLHFSAPKQSKTRRARVEKSILQILNGKGLNDE